MCSFLHHHDLFASGWTDAKPEPELSQQQNAKPEQSTVSQQGTNKPKQSTKSEHSQQPDSKPEQSTVSQQGVPLEQSTRSQQGSKPESVKSEQSQQPDARPKQSKSKLSQKQDDEPEQSSVSRLDVKPEQSTRPQQVTKGTSTDPTQLQPTSTQETQTEQQFQQDIPNSGQSTDHKQPGKSHDQDVVRSQQATKATSTDPSPTQLQPTSTQAAQTEQQYQQVIPKQSQQGANSGTDHKQPGKSCDQDAPQATGDTSIDQSSKPEFTGSKQHIKHQVKRNPATKQSPGLNGHCSVVSDQSASPLVQQNAATDDSTSQQIKQFKQTHMNPTGQDSIVNEQKSLSTFSQQKCFSGTDVQQSLSSTNLSSSDQKSSLTLPRADNQSVDGLIAQISSLMSTGLVEYKSSTSNARKSVLVSSSSVNKQRSVADFSQSHTQSPRAAEVTNLTVGIADEWVWNASGTQNQSSMQTSFLPPIIVQNDSVSELQSVDKDSAVADLVSGLIQKVNNSDNLEDIATTDATSAKYVQDEVEKLTKMVTDFVEQSTGIICKEGMCNRFNDFSE